MGHLKDEFVEIKLKLSLVNASLSIVFSLEEMLIVPLDPALPGVYSVKVYDTARPRAYEEEERVSENKKCFSQVKMSRFDRALCRRTRFKIVESISGLIMIMMCIIT